MVTISSEGLCGGCERFLWVRGLRVSGRGFLDACAGCEGFTEGLGVFVEATGEVTGEVTGDRLRKTFAVVGAAEVGVAIRVLQLKVRVKVRVGQECA